MRLWLKRKKLFADDADDDDYKSMLMKFGKEISPTEPNEIRIFVLFRSSSAGCSL